MEKQTHNGWTNYATWRVNLEVFDGNDHADTWGGFSDAYDLGQALKEYVEESLINDMTPDGLAKDYALAFLSDVNWYEIAEHIIAEITEGAE
jgi:hypothetical protein